MISPRPRLNPERPLAPLLRPCRAALRRVIVFSGIINLLTLSTSLYMMQVYDRVLTSQSRDTLIFLTLAVSLAILLSAVLEGVRQSVANSSAGWFAGHLGGRLLSRALEQRLVIAGRQLDVLRELNTVKGFAATPTVFHLIDMLWVPLYLAATFLLHIWFGVIATIGAVALFALALYNERATRNRVRENAMLASANMQFAESLMRNSEVIDAMGMADRTVAHWTTGYAAEIEAAEQTNLLSIRAVAAAKFVRQMIQILLLGAGALLVIDMQLTGGAMIAGTIIVARLLAPIDASMSYWKQFVLARQAFQRLDRFCTLPAVRRSDMVLPKPNGDLVVDRVTFMAPGIGTPILKGVDFRLSAGEMLAIVGPSASGKTTLSRLLVGVLKPVQGHVRLDGADTFDWARTDFGPRIGYLPQDVELLPGSVRLNIARFDPQALPDEVIRAAIAADCHRMILEFDDGYDMVLGEGGGQLSGGQRQRVGLARALFRDPRLVVLDEPNASLDTQGDAALVRALTDLKRRRVTTVVVSHRPNLLQLADKILVLQDGRVTKFGPAAQVLHDMGAPRAPVRAPAAIAPAPSAAVHGAGEPVVTS